MELRRYKSFARGTRTNAPVAGSVSRRSFIHASRITHHGSSGVTLMELLIVISIIGLLSLPALKGFNRSNLIASANRQLLDDLAQARQRAISDRTTVHVVFVSPEILTN